MSEALRKELDSGRSFNHKLILEFYNTDKDTLFEFFNSSELTDDNIYELVNSIRICVNENRDAINLSELRERIHNKVFLNKLISLGVIADLNVDINDVDSIIKCLASVIRYGTVKEFDEMFEKIDFSIFKKRNEAKIAEFTQLKDIVINDRLKLRDMDIVKYQDIESDLQLLSRKALNERTTKEVTDRVVKIIDARLNEMSTTEEKKLRNLLSTVVGTSHEFIRFLRLVDELDFDIIDKDNVASLIGGANDVESATIIMKRVVNKLDWEGFDFGFAWACSSSPLPVIQYYVSCYMADPTAKSKTNFHGENILNHMLRKGKYENLEYILSLVDDGVFDFKFTDTMVRLTFKQGYPSEDGIKCFDLMLDRFDPVNENNVIEYYELAKSNYNRVKSTGATMEPYFLSRYKSKFPELTGFNAVKRNHRSKRRFIKSR